MKIIIPIGEQVIMFNNQTSVKVTLQGKFLLTSLIVYYVN